MIELYDTISIQRIKNLENMLLEVYSRREKKIVNLALIKARTNENVFDISVMLEEERNMFNSIVKILKEQRKIILEEKNKKEYEYKSIKTEEKIKENEEKNIREKTEIKEENTQSIIVEENEEEQKKILELVKVQFLKPINKFVDEELNYYGPYDEEETAKIPKKIARILVEKGEAKLIE